MIQDHEIDFAIHGEEMQFVEIELDPQESVIAEAGSLMYMKPNIHMETIFGDGSKKDQQSGLLGKMLSAGKRLLTGESLFMTAYTHTGEEKSHVAFAAPYPGKIIPLNLAQLGGKVVCQKDAFLCAAKGVEVAIELQQKLGTGIFGGEGFIMQKLIGDGMAFMHAGGHVVEKKLNAGETLKIDTGCVVGYTHEVKYSIERIRGVKNMIFGGEGMFLATLTGPGTVWMQTLPISRLASRIIQYAPQTGGNRKGEGSILGGLGDILDGDNF